MSVWIAAFFLIPLADQAIKTLLRQQLGDRVVSLGPLGSVRVIDAPIWWARGGFANAGDALDRLARRRWRVAGTGQPHPRIRVVRRAASRGSLSHMIETSRRGRVCDYLCLHFWPAFNLADAAISIGTVGFIVSALVNFLH